MIDPTAVLRLLSLLAALCLPWRAAFRLLFKRAGSPVRDPLPAEGADSPADLAALAARAAPRAALYGLLDAVDFMLVHLRGDRWQRKWVCRAGARWPDSGPFIALTFHYGAGMWSVADLARQGRRVAWIHASSPGALDALPWHRRLLARWRLWTVRRIGRGITIATGGARARARQWLDGGGVVVALIDAPHYGRRQTLDIDLMGHRVGLPVGLVSLAIRSGVPIYLYTMGLEGDGPRRRLAIAGPFTPTDEQRFAHDLGTFFEAALRYDPGAWPFWSALPHAFPAQPRPRPLAPDDPRT